MIHILNLQVLTGSDKLVLISSTNSRNKISAIIQNTSDRPFLLNPNASLGFNISKPDSLNIPRTLPFCRNNFPTRHFSTEALISKSNKSQGQIKYASTRDDGSYFEGMTNLTNNIKNTINQVYSIAKSLTPGESENFDLASISLRCLKQKGSSKNLVPVQVNLKSLYLNRNIDWNINVSIYILPWDSSMYPAEDLLCETCNHTRGLHFSHTCPSLDRQRWKRKWNF